MFSEIDKIIFPDSCEVIQVSSQQFVYPIFKCGRSSLTESIAEKKWNIVPIDEICKISKPITVFLRDPKERFISGVNTYLQNLQSADPTLDTKTILFFVNQYMFLNNHYTPQFFWLLNLARYTDPATPVNFSNFKDISNLTHIHSTAGITPMTKDITEYVKAFDWKKLELYFFLDQQLIDRIGQTITIKDLLVEIKNSQPKLYDLIFLKSINLTNALPQT